FHPRRQDVAGGRERVHSPFRAAAGRGTAAALPNLGCIVSLSPGAGVTFRAPVGYTCAVTRPTSLSKRGLVRTGFGTRLCCRSIDDRVGPSSGCRGGVIRRDWQADQCWWCPQPTLDFRSMASTVAR